MANDQDEYSIEIKQLSAYALDSSAKAMQEQHDLGQSRGFLLSFSEHGRVIAVGSEDIAEALRRAEDHLAWLQKDEGSGSGYWRLDGNVTKRLQINSDTSAVHYYIDPTKSARERPIDRFIHLYFSEIRSLICRTKKGDRNLGHATTGAIAGLGAWIAHLTGATGHAGEAFAAAILVTITSAAKGAFCKMTVAEATAALRHVAGKDKIARPIIVPTTEEIVEVQETKGRKERPRKNR